MNYPKISILVPARNEEDNLPVLLQSLEKLDWPEEKTEILLGNDASDDRTGALMDAFARQRTGVKVIHLREENDQPLTGKTRVLDELARQATGEYLFFTDADIALPARWIAGMLAGFSPGTGVVVGATGFRRDSWGATLQGIEWLMALSIFKIAADKGLPSTGLGNNMAVSREAYDAVGGYRTIGFSIVEDYFLYKKIIEAGFGFRHLLTPEVLAFTVPPKRYFEQRRRWIMGAMENAPAAMAGGVLQALCIPVLLLLGLIHPVIPALISALLVLIYAGFILYFGKKLQISGYLRYLPLFALYISGAWFLQFIYYLLSRETVWKGRKY
ncbi:glycosyltransferase [Leadbetterella sp. DM7]|uniref:glycosyltransferase n=1 Tax=Leadbetterella sp. DM7 TaxID=3235085 RepID=UPI00349EE978